MISSELETDYRWGGGGGGQYGQSLLELCTQ